MSSFPPHPGELPLLKLRNKIKPQFPVDPAFSKERREARKEQGQELVEEEPAEGALSLGDRREKLVKHLQLMLRDLGFDLGASGDNNDGVDGIFGDKTRKAVREFQEKNLDVDRNPLKVDGKVGPRTADALNRRMVGLWYDKYETPKEMTEGKTFITITSEHLTEGILFVTDDKAKESEAIGAIERRRRTDGRAAFENIIQPVQQRSGPDVHIVNEELDSVKEGVMFEEDNRRKITTSNEGVIRLAKSKTLLSLIDEDESKESASIIVGGECQESEEVFTLSDEDKILDQETGQEIDPSVAFKESIDSNVA